MKLVTLLVSIKGICVNEVFCNILVIIVTFDVSNNGMDVSDVQPENMPFIDVALDVSRRGQFVSDVQPLKKYPKLNTLEVSISGIVVNEEQPLNIPSAPEPDTPSLKFEKLKYPTDARLVHPLNKVVAVRIEVFPPIFMGAVDTSLVHPANKEFMFAMRLFIITAPSNFTCTDPVANLSLNSHS